MKTDYVVETKQNAESMHKSLLLVDLALDSKKKRDFTNRIRSHSLLGVLLRRQRLTIQTSGDEQQNAESSRDDKTDDRHCQRDVELVS